jgi:hypothetical protein
MASLLLRIVCVLVSLSFVIPFPQILAQSLEGSWRVVVGESDDMDPWREWTVRITVDDDSLTLVRHWQAGRYYQHDSLRVSVDGSVNTIPVRPGKWMDHVYLGVFVPENATRAVTATRDQDEKMVRIVSVVPLETSQADTTVQIISTFRLDPTSDRLRLTETRSSRTTGAMHYTFDRR